MKDEKRFLQLIIIYQDFTYKIRVKENLIIEEVKLEIDKQTGISLTFNYLFFLDENILEEYDKMKISDFILMKNKKFSIEDDYIFTILMKEDLQDKLADLEYLKCLKHNLLKGNVFCNACKVLICNKCHLLEHSEHIIITDDQEFYDAVYQFLYQFERKMKKTFGKTKASDMVRICIDLESNLDKYKDAQLDIVENLANSAIESISNLKSLELIRLDNIVNGGIYKVNKFREDTKAVLNLHENLKSGSNDKDEIINQFKRANKAQKIDLLLDIQSRNSNLIRDTSKVEGVIEKLKNFKEHDIANLIKISKDLSFYLTTNKLLQILEKYKNKLNFKLKTEKPDLLIKRMEAIKSSSEESIIYNKNLNLIQKTNDGRSITKVIQSIENSNKISAFDLESKSFSIEEIFFEEKYFFYLNSRSINIGGKLYVIGGDFDGKSMNTIIEIDSENFEYKFLKQMDFGRSGHSIINYDNKFIIVISGANGNKTCESYNIEKNHWSKLPLLNHDRIGPSLMILNKTEILCFFGKSYDNELKKWVFVESFEKTTVDNKSSVWLKFYMKSKEFNMLNKRSFSGIIACPNNRLFIVGGQCLEDGRIQTTSNIIEIDLKSMSFMRSDLNMPKPTAFIDTNFYFHNANALQFDNQGCVLFYSIIFHEMWNLENYE